MAEETVVRREIEQQVGTLLENTAKTAENRVKKRWLTAVGIVLVLALGGLLSLQVQFYHVQQDLGGALFKRCEARNAQQASVADFAAVMARVEEANEFVGQRIRERRVRAYGDLARAYGDTLDCTIYR